MSNKIVLVALAVAAVHMGMEGWFGSVYAGLRGDCAGCKQT